MYSEWTSLGLMLQKNGDENQSVLEKFGLNTSKEVTLGVVRQLASNLGISQPAEPSPLITDKEVSYLVNNSLFNDNYRCNGVWKFFVLAYLYRYQNMKQSRIVLMFIVSGCQLF